MISSSWQWGLVLPVDDYFLTSFRSKHIRIEPLIFQRLISDEIQSLGVSSGMIILRLNVFHDCILVSLHSSTGDFSPPVLFRGMFGSTVMWFSLGIDLRVSNDEGNSHFRHLTTQILWQMDWPSYQNARTAWYIFLLL